MDYCIDCGVTSHLWNGKYITCRNYGFTYCESCHRCHNEAQCFTNMKKRAMKKKEIKEAMRGYDPQIGYLWKQPKFTIDGEG